MGSFPDGVYRAQFPYYYRNPEGMPQEAALDYYLNSIKDVFEQCGPADSIAAIVVQPLQGEGGFIPAPIEWVKAVRKLQMKSRQDSAAQEECLQHSTGKKQEYSLIS